MASVPDTLNNSRIHKVHVKGDYTELEEYNATISEPKTMHQLRPEPTSSNRDVESGRYGISVQNASHGETWLDTSF